MRHTTPTNQAHTHTLREADALPGQACLKQADLPSSLLTAEREAALAERENLLISFSAAERLQLSEAAKRGLDEEIRLLKSFLRRFHREVDGRDEPPTFKELGQSLDLLGLTISRLASAMRVNHVLNPESADGEKEKLIQLLQAVFTDTPEEN